MRDSISSSFQITNASFSEMMEQLPYGVLIMDQQHIIFANYKIAKMLGLNHQNELSNQSLKEYIFEESFAYFSHWKEKIVSDTSNTMGHRTELVLVKKSKALFNVEMIGIHFHQDEKILLQLLITDISNRKKINAELESFTQQNNNKSVNHELLEQYANRAINDILKKNRMTAIMWIDLDHLEFIHESYGRRIRDILVQSAAERLRQIARKDDILLTIGGDEFVIVFQGVKNFNNITLATKRIIKALSAPYFIESYEIKSTTRAGVSVYPDNGVTSQTLINHAKLALEQAKKQQKSYCQIFTPSMTHQLKGQTELLFQLKHAVKNNEFRLLYQPIVDSKTGKIMSLEALLRWQRSENELLSPGAFLSLAEDEGIIFGIGEWIIETACKQNQLWLQQGLRQLPISINLSTRQFHPDAKLAEIVQTALTKTELSSRYLQFEMSENVTILDIGTETVSKLKAFNIKLTIDDFGARFFSLHVLKRYQIDYIKIDQTLIAGIPNNINSTEIIVALIAMCKKLNIGIIAEGVEREEQLKFLQANDCIAVQGNYIYSPLRADEISPLLKKLSQNAEDSLV